MFDLGSDALDITFRGIDLTGVVLNGVLGGRLARQKRFDAVGFVILAILSAMGGGIIRDVMLQAGPPVALTDPLYISAALIGASIAFLWKLDSRAWRIVLVMADGTVLGCWAATGAMKTLSLGFGVLPALMLGLTTAIGGGMIRDITAGNIPTVFGGNTLSAPPAIVSASIMVIMYKMGLPEAGLLTATIVGTSFTVLAHWRRWQLPQHTGWTLPSVLSQVAERARLEHAEDSPADTDSPANTGVAEDGDPSAANPPSSE